jgi:hypothetical protein
MAVFWLPVLILQASLQPPIALDPTAVFASPVALSWSAKAPIAVLLLPMGWGGKGPLSAKFPTAVFLLPLVPSWSAPVPKAVFWLPVALVASAPNPKAVCWKPPLLLTRALVPPRCYPANR